MKKLFFLTALWSVVITATAQQEAVQAKKQWFLKPMAGINVSALRDTGDEDAVNDQRVPDDHGIENPKELQNLSKDQRDGMLNALCDLGATIRQTARLTGICYGVIQKVRKNEL